MINSRFDWHGDNAIKLAADASWNSIQKMVIFFWQQVVDTLNVPNTGVQVKRSRGKGSYTIYPNSSKPGEPPRKRTGWLQRHVKYEFNKTDMTARVGLIPNAKYGMFLEFGTSRVAARPWLLATLKNNLGKLQAIVGSSIR